jgi:tetratricopeptide (TPR) repeat protein
MSPAEWAKELIFEAYELTPKEAMNNIIEALELDPDCIEGFEFLGNLGDSMPISLAFYEKGVALGDKQFGGEYLEQHRGHFWGMHETRSYMRCLMMTAEIMGFMKRPMQSIPIYEKMILLNPSDNQGIRYQFGLALLDVGDFKKFEEYDQLYQREISTSSNFNRALAEYKKKGSTPAANKLMQIAVNSNGFVVAKLNSKNLVNDPPPSYMIGSKEEATVYAFFGQEVWQKTKGALVWAKGFKKGK